MSQGSENERIETAQIYVWDHGTESVAADGFDTMERAETWATEHGPEYEAVDGREPRPDGGTSQTVVYRANGHEFEVVKSFDDGTEILRCCECLRREVLDGEPDPEESLELRTAECRIEWLRDPDDGFHGVALRNSNCFSGRELIGVKETDEKTTFDVVDSVRIYDDDAPELASLLSETWGGW